jgi:tetratricopeptide (TPR) repeat protein
MNLILSGLALVLAGASTMASAQAQAQAPAQKQQAQTPEDSIKPSKKATKAIVDLQTAVNAKDVATIPAKLAAAQAVATTKEDHYWIARMQLKAAADSKDNAAAASAIDAIAATGLMPASDVADLYSALGGSAFNAKQYDAAAKAFEHQIALDPNNATAMVNLAATRSAAGDKSQALSALQRAIKASTATGKKLDENVYQQAVGMAYEAKLPDAIQLSRDWVTAYPNPESWRNTIAIFRNETHQDGEGTLDLLRLMQAAGAMQKPTDYAMFVNADLDQQNYAEAQAVLDAGIAAHVVDPAGADFKQLAAEVKGKKKATAADLDAALKMSPSPINMLHIGDQFYAMGDYAKAAGIYRQTMGKSGMDPDVSNLHLGMALLRSGDKAGAIAAFKAVTGARADIAKLWLIYAQQDA